MGAFLLSMNSSDIQESTIAKLSELSYPHKILSSTSCLIASKSKTSSEICKDILLDENKELYMFVKLSAYYGLQMADVWEWINLQDDDEP